MNTTITPEALAGIEARRESEAAGLDADLVRGFLTRALSHDAIDDAVTEMLFEHIVEGRYHPSVIASSLPLRIEEILGVTTAEDWQVLAEALIIEGPGADGQIIREGAAGQARVSEQGTQFDVGLIRDFLWTALTDPVAEARLGDLRSRLKGGHPAHPSLTGQALKQIVDDAVHAGSEEDWSVITGQLIADARGVNGEV
jgi:hypothetical protein